MSRGPFDLIGDLTKDDTSRLQPLGRDGAALGIDHPHALEALGRIGQLGQLVGGQHIAGRCARGLGAGRVEQKVDGLALMRAQKRPRGPLGDRDAGFGKEDMRGQVGEGDFTGDVAEFVEERRAEAAEAKAAAALKKEEE